MQAALSRRLLVNLKLAAAPFLTRMEQTCTLQTKDYIHFKCGDLTFEGAADAEKALPGDNITVLVFNTEKVIRINERADHSRIVGVLELNSKTRYGITSRGAPVFLFKPVDEAYPPFYVSSTHKDLSRPVLAVIDFLDWKDTTCPRGTLFQILGPCGDLQAEEEALAWHAAPHRWKKGITEEVKSLSIATRTWKHGSVFNVDPAGCRDVDDAISIEYDDSGRGIHFIGIHITNVASWIHKYPVLKAAAKIGSTVYKDGKVVCPMFPVTLSEGLFSLCLGEKRHVVTLSFNWDSNAKKIEDLEWSAHQITLTESYTYETVYESEHAATLREIASHLAKKDMPDSHDWVAQLMILYNCEAAKLPAVQANGLLRRHSAPQVARFDSVKSLLGEDVAKRIANSAGEYCLGNEDSAHWGLQVSKYCHATSPIRRWADCVNQGCILERLRVRPRELNYTEELVAELNDRMKRVRQFERELQYMTAILGPAKVREGTIVAAKGGKVDFWVPEWGRIIKMRDSGTWTPGDTVNIELYCDPTKRNWKRRVTFKLKGNLPQ